jgi:hypothetical protein
VEGKGDRGAVGVLEERVAETATLPTTTASTADAESLIQTAVAALTPALPTPTIACGAMCAPAAVVAVPATFAAGAAPAVAVPVAAKVPAASPSAATVRARAALRGASLRAEASSVAPRPPSRESGLHHRRRRAEPRRHGERRARGHVRLPDDAVATLQVQARELAALRRQVEELQRSCAPKKR